MHFPTVRLPFLKTALTVSVLSSSIAAQQPVYRAAAILPDAPSASLGGVRQSSSLDAAAQSSQANQNQQPAPPLTPEEERKAAEAQLQQELHQRMAGVVPNFNAVLGGTALPLSPGQKMRAAFRSAIDPYQFGFSLITSAIGQATDSHSSIDANGTRHGYGQGWAGFGERYGANYVDQFDGTIIGNGILPVLLKQDPRYYRMGKGSVKKRLLYSLSTTVICHGDNGKLEPNWSNVLGNIASGGISNLYYPRADRGALLTIEQGLEVTAYGSIGALLIEFYPDIRSHIHKKRPAEPTVGNTAP